MAEFNIRSDAVDVEQIMQQIRARIREKRGIDYTGDEIRQLAGVKLEKFLEPTGVRSDLLDQFRRRQLEPPINYGFEDDTIFASSRAPLSRIRRLLNPVLKLFFNPNPIIRALHLQSRINDGFYARDPLYFEVMHNLVLEVTKLGIEVRNLKMRVESFSSRLDFDERRARALEGVVQYKPGTERPPVETEGPPAGGEEAGEERKRRRRRRRRRSGRQGDAAGPATDATGAAGGGIDNGEEAPEGRAAGAEPAGQTDTGPDADEHRAQAWDEPAGDRTGDTDAEDQ